MNMASTGRAKADMNVTPLIDVLLVLLIIFMVITPLASHVVPALVPQSPDRAAPDVPDESPVVLVLAADGSMALNQEKLTRREELAGRLREIFARRSRRVLFVDAAAETEFELVARAMDEARPIAAVGLMPRVR